MTENRMMATKPSIDDLRIDRSHDRRGRRLIGLLVAAVLLLALGAAGYRLLRAADVPAVRVASVQEETGSAAPSAVLNASGYVTARRRATVSSKVTGKVVEVLVEEGRAVQKGQVLARLDTSTAERYLALAEAELAAAHRAVSETEVRLEEARINLKRTQSLVSEGILNLSELDKAQAEVDALAARLSLGREQTKVSERQVAVRQNDIEDLTIKAPFSGVAVSKDAQPGEMISPVSAGGGFTRTGICTLVDMSSLEIEVDVNEAYINRVTSGQRVEAVLDAYPDWRIPGKVITTVPTADRQKATVLVRIAFDQLDPRILPDMGVKVAFLDAARPAAARPSQPELVVPRTALRKDNGQDVAFVLSGDHIERRAVRLGAVRGDKVVVLAGLQAGEQVVVEGPQELRDGSRVSVK